MKLFTIERLSSEMIKLLVSREDSKGWVDHGGPSLNLEANIARNFKIIETGYMQGISDVERAEQIHKAFRLGMYGVLVDIWKELVAMSKGDYDFVRRWSLMFHLSSEATGCSLLGIEPFIQFGETVKCSNQHYLSNNVETLDMAMNLLRRSFATMTRESNALITKERAKAEIFKLLKANPLIQKTFLEQALISSVMDRLTSATSPVTRAGLLDNIFNLLITGRNTSPITDAQFCNYVKSELDRGGYYIFETEDALNMFTAWAEDNKVYPADMEMVVHSNEVDATKQNIMFVPGPITPIDPSNLKLMLIDVLDYSGLQAAGAATDILRAINQTQVTQKEEFVKEEPYVQFMGTDHLVDVVRPHGTEEEEVKYLFNSMTTPGIKNLDRKFFVSYIHRSKHQRALISMFLINEDMLRLDKLDPRQRSMVVDKAIDIRLGTVKACQDIFDIVGAKGKPIPTSIYENKAPEREVDKVIGIDPIKEGPTEMKQPKARPTDFGEILKEMLDIRAKAAYPNASQEQLDQLVGTWTAQVRTAIRPLLANIQPEINPSSTTNMEQVLNTVLGSSNIDRYTGMPISQPTPTANPTNMYAQEQSRQLKVTRVSSDDKVEVDGYGAFHIHRDSSNGMLSIIFVACNGNHGHQLVQCSYTEADANYIVDMLYHGIEKGHPHKSVALAVQRVTSPSFSASAGFGMDYNPGFTNGF